MEEVKRFTLTRVLVVVLSFTLGVALLVMGLSVRSEMRKTNNKVYTDRVTELLQVKKDNVETYFRSVEDYIVQFSKNQVVMDVLNTRSEESIAEALKYIQDSAGERLDIENLYIADYESVTLASKNDSIMNARLRTGEKLEQLHDALKNAQGGVYNTGIMKSPSTGRTCMSMYYLLNNENGEPVGFVGMALEMNALYDILNSLKSNNGMDTEFKLIDMEGMVYIGESREDIGGTPLDEKAIEKIDKYNVMGSTGVVTDTETIDGEERLVAYTSLKDRGWVFAIDVSTKEISSAISAAVIKTLLILLGVILVVIACIYTVMKLFLRKITKISEALTLMAKLNMSNEVVDGISKYTSDRTEAGELATSAESLLKTIREVVGGIKNGTETLSAESDSINDNITRNNAAIEQIGFAIGDVAKGATSQANDVQEAVSLTKEVERTMHVMEDKVHELDKVAIGIDNVNDTVKESLAGLKKSNDEVAMAVGKVKSQNYENEKLMANVEKTVDIVNSITESIKLLGLNATIEAARAGSVGKGFAVVASEIQKLAIQSTDSNKEIKDIVAQIKDGSNTSTELVNSTILGMQGQTKKIGEAVKILESLGECEKECDNVTASIKAVVDDTVKSMRKMVDVLNELSALAEENAASSEETSASIETINSGSAGVSVLSAKIKEIANEMKEITDKFIL